MNVDEGKLCPLCNGKESSSYDCSYVSMVLGIRTCDPDIAYYSHVTSHIQTSFPYHITRVTSFMITSFNVEITPTILCPSVPIRDSTTANETLKTMIPSTFIPSRVPSEM